MGVFSDFAKLFVFAMSSFPTIPLEGISLPPQEYDRPCPPKRCKVLEFNLNEIHEQCFGNYPGVGSDYALACARNFGSLGWVIIMPKRGTLPDKNWNQLLRHEYGHTWGWEHSHRGARYSDR